MAADERYGHRNSEREREKERKKEKEGEGGREIEMCELHIYIESKNIYSS